MTTALVLGGARSLWEDASAALDLFRPDIVLAVNDAIAHYAGPLDYAVTLHPEKLGDWLGQRERRRFSPVVCVVSHKKAQCVDDVIDYHFPGMTSSGSSGLFAVKVAMDKGADRVVLAGVPMTKAHAHFFDDNPWRTYGSYTPAWELVMPLLRPKVRSLSGWTRDKLGAPSSEWLSE